MSAALLIAGTSHVGKSTLADEIGKELGWEVVSTDKLARHPGRPWPKAPDHVAEFYRQLSDATIYQMLLHHHQNMRHGIERIVRSHQENELPFVFEGSALRPESIVDMLDAKMTAVCLYANDQFLRDRIYQQSSYVTLSDEHQLIIDKFTARSLTDNENTLKAAKEYRLDCVDVADDKAVADIQSQLRKLV